MVSVAAGASAAGQGSRTSPVGPIDFDIPAQPLGKALVAFGATAGLDLYYNAALAEGRRSATVMGKLTPIVALQRLLEGTGLVPEATAPYSVILVPAPRKPVVPNGSVVATPTRYETYFATIQARISDALCRNLSGGQNGDETFLRIWLAASGVIDQVEVLGTDAERANNRGLADVVQGLAVGTPPAGMPEPVTLVVFPPSAGQRDCRSSASSREAN